MKKKRYFCDWYKDNGDKLFEAVIAAIVSIAVVAAVILCDANSLFDGYSEDKFENLEEIVRHIEVQDKTISVKKAEGIKYEISNEEDVTTIIYYYDNQTSPYGTMIVQVNVSDDNEVSDPIRNYSSKKQYITGNIGKLIVGIIGGTILLMMVMLLLTFIVLSAILTVSENHKQKEKVS